LHRKLTISIDEEVYQGLHRVIGRGRISRFLQELARPHVVRNDLDGAYAEMAADRQREEAAHEWSEALVGDVISQAE
jgi:predicted CopG family antitoxin